MAFTIIGAAEVINYLVRIKYRGEVEGKVTFLEFQTGFKKIQ